MSYHNLAKRKPLLVIVIIEYFKAQVLETRIALCEMFAFFWYTVLCSEWDKFIMFFLREMRPFFSFLPVKRTLESTNWFMSRSLWPSFISMASLKAFCNTTDANFSLLKKWLAQFTEIHPGPQNILQYPSATSAKANRAIFQVKWVLLWYFSFWMIGGISLLVARGSNFQGPCGDTRRGFSLIVKMDVGSVDW